MGHSLRSYSVDFKQSQVEHPKSFKTEPYRHGPNGHCGSAGHDKLSFEFGR